MQILIGTLVMLSITTTVCFSQTIEKFDIINFKNPAGWVTQADNDAVQIAGEDNRGGICLISLFKSVEGTGNSKQDFEIAWQEIVKKTVTVDGNITRDKGVGEGGWNVEVGSARFVSDGRSGVVMLFTYSGYGKMVNVMVLTNTLDFQNEISAFLASLSLDAPQVKQSQAAANQSAGDSQAALQLTGNWRLSWSRYGNYGQAGIEGYFIRRYQFFADGTYRFTSRLFDMSSRNITIVKETGRYTSTKDTLTISPEVSVIETYLKKNGADELGTLVSSQKRPLEKATYNYALHYFSGIDEWNLVLRTSRQTERDGPFSSNADFKDSWLYSRQYADEELTNPRRN